MLTNVNKPPLELEQQSSIVCDWLSLYTIGTIHDTHEYKFNLLPYSTRQFKKVYSIDYHNTTFATATAEPHSKIINARAIIIKFENKFLYTRSASYLIEKFLRACKLSFKSITRADIARDFHTFFNGLKPQTFISDFFAGTYLKNGRGKFSVIGEQMQKNVYDYLSFGSRSTGKRIYLYNKSKELRQVKDKPWIKWFWQRNGLAVDKDIWRLEFSFKGSQNKIVDEFSGQLDKIHWRDLFKPAKLIWIMSAAIKSIFSFKIKSGTKNKTRMKDLQLFNSIYSGVKLIKLPDEESPTKTIRILLRKLVTEYRDIIYKDTFSAAAIQGTIDAISKKYNMKEFLIRVLDYTPEPMFFSYSEDNFLF